MAKNINHLQHVKSSVVENGLPKLPAPNVLVEGELAVNYATDKETISLKNSSGIVVTFSSDNYYSEKKLGSGFTGENSAVTVTQAINDSERVVAAALTDLDERKLDASAYTQQDLSEYATKQWVDEERLGSGFTGENSGNTVTKVIEDNELAISAALNDLEERKLDESAFTESVGDFYTKAEVDDKLGAEFSGTNYTQSVSEAIDEIETVTAAALNDLNNRKLDASATTEFATYDWVEGQGYLKEHQSLSGYATTAVTNQLRTDVNTLSGNSITGASYDSTNKKINFTTSTGKTIQIDATNFIKDGMVNDVAVSGVVSGGSTVKCLVVTFNTDAGKENINIPLSEIFNPSLYYTKTEIDNVLGSGFTVSSVTSSITDVIKENELIVASALNDLEDRKLDASAYTPTDLSAYATEEWVDDRLGSGFTDSSVTEVFNETEEVIAAALSDLDSRISGNTTYITQVNAKADSIARGLSGYTPSGYSYSKTETDTKLNTKLDASAYTPTDLSGYYTKGDVDNKLADKLDASAYTPTDLSDYYTKDDVNDKLGEWFSGDTSGETFKSVTQVIREDERAIAAALTDLDERKLDASAFTESVGDFYTKSEINDFLGEWFTGNNAVSSVTEVIEDNELITAAAALNDLNDKINTVSGSQLTASSFKTINGQTIVGSGNISIEGSGGGQANVIETVKVNGTALTPDGNKAVNIASVPSSIVTQDTTHRFVSDTEKSTWNNKQNALSNASVLTGITSQKVSNWDSAATSAHSHSNKTVLDNLTQTVIDNSHTHSNKTVLDGITTAKTAQWDTVTAKTDNTAFTAHTANTTAHITAAERTAWNGKQDAISDLASIRTSAATQSDWNATSGVAMIKNKPTIPTSLSDINSAHTHSEYATTGTVNTLNNTVTAHTGNSDIHVTTANKTQWNNAISGVSFNGATATVNNHVAAITATFPAAPGTLTTTATTAQSTATNEALSGNIALHKVSKTGSYNDLNDKPTITDNYVTGGRVDTSNGTIILSRSGGLGEVRITGMNQYVNGVADGKVSKTGDTMTGALTISADTANTLNVIGGGNTGVIKPVLNVGTTYHQTIFRVFDDGTSHAQINGTLEVDTSDGVAMKSTVSLSGNTGFETNGKIIGSAFQVSGHTNQNLNELLLANGRILVLPTFSGADNGKILGIQNGQLAWITPTTIYTGTGTPSSSQGNNGDIYLQTS